MKLIFSTVVLLKKDKLSYDIVCMKTILLSFYSKAEMGCKNQCRFCQTVSKVNKGNQWIFFYFYSILSIACSNFYIPFLFWNFYESVCYVILFCELQRNCGTLLCSIAYRPNVYLHIWLCTWVHYFHILLLNIFFLFPQSDF